MTSTGRRKRETPPSFGRFTDQHATGLQAGDALHLAIAYNHGAKVRNLDQALLTAVGMLGVGAGLL